MPPTDAADRLRDGGVIAFPTETVYGLGADAFNEIAVRRIFALKGRPANNPLIVHGHDVDVLKPCVRDWPEAAERLGRRFWPGPLALVLSKSPDLPAVVTGGGETVAVRVPDHPLALEMLRAFGRPVAAPSANRSARVSPTTADHVRQEFGDAVPVLDGGPCRLGIESTVLDLTGDAPTVLRPGAISVAMLEDALNQRLIVRGGSEGRPASPGRLPRHYAPSKPTRLVNRVELSKLVEQPDLAAVLALAPCAPLGPHLLFEMPAGPAEYAARLYATLREADQSAAVAIWLELPPDAPEWFAVRDRLTRAAALGKS